MWMEFYAANAPGGLAAGELVPHTRVRFGRPAAGLGGAAASDGTVAPSGHANRLGEGEGDDSSVDDDGDGVLHEMGIPPPG